jgi:hypothetical protein
VIDFPIPQNLGSDLAPFVSLLLLLKSLGVLFSECGLTVGITFIMLTMTL